MGTPRSHDERGKGRPLRDTTHDARAILLCVLLTLACGLAPANAATPDLKGGEGVCCMSWGECIEVENNDICMFEFGGTWYAGESCETIQCPIVGGACCLPEGECAEADNEEVCMFEMGGTWYAGQSCEMFQCPTGGGACCLPEGECVGAENEEMCIFEMGGTWYAGESCETFECPVGGGACCLPEGECVGAENEEICRFEMGGTWYAGESCETFECPVGGGACCLPEGECVDADGDDLYCVFELGGAWYPGENCESFECPSLSGACCMPNGECVDLGSEGDCASLFGGTWYLGEACESFECPSAGGACCMPTGGCVDLGSEGDCVSLFGGTWYAGESCSSFECPSTGGACCMPTGGCIDLGSEGDCAGLFGGTWYAGESCESFECPSTGACCVWTGECVVATLVECEDLGGTYQGDDVACESVECEPTYCPAGASSCYIRHISRVQIGAIDNETDCAEGGYGDYTYLSADLHRGAVTTLIVSQLGLGISPLDRCIVWIDYNRDNQFAGLDETLYARPIGWSPVQFVFEIAAPPYAQPGPTRLRIRLGPHAFDEPPPCGWVDDEEVEDYTVNIVDVTGACCLDEGACEITLEAECAGAWAGPDTTCDLPDCNDNGISDTCEILSGMTPDCDGNGIPDVCDIEDCPPDELSCADCQSDGIPDGCQLWDVGAGGGTQPPETLSWDDGTCEISFGLGESGELAWVHNFTVAGAAEIQSIQLCFGTPLYPDTSGVTPGKVFHVYVWNDPDGDGAPYDAQLLASAEGHAEADSIDSNILQSVPINAIVSGSFFIGASMHMVEMECPASFDSHLDTWSGLAWRTYTLDAEGGSYDPTAWIPWHTHSMVNDLGAYGDWMLRAEMRAFVPPHDCNGNGIPDDCELCGDLDGDNDVDYDDYAMFLDAFGGETDGSPSQDWCCDYDNSGGVGLADYDIWLSCYRDYVEDPFASPPPGPDELGSDLTERAKDTTRRTRASSAQPSVDIYKSPATSRSK